MAGEVHNFVESILDVHQHLRDDCISYLGEKVLFQVPDPNTVVSEMGTVENTVFVDYPTEAIINRKAYQQLLDIENPSEEFTIPLDAFVKISDNIPRGSRVTLTVFDKNKQDVTRVFEVVGVEIINNRQQLAKTLKLTPYRG